MDLSTLPVTARDIARATQKDKALAVTMRLVQHGHWPSKPTDDVTPFYRRREQLSCHDGCLLWGQRVEIPSSLRPQLLKELHDGHVGVCRMKALARSFVWWPGLDREIEAMAASCDACKTTAANPTKVSWHPWQYPQCTMGLGAHRLQAVE